MSVCSHLIIDKDTKNTHYHRKEHLQEVVLEKLDVQI